MTKKSWGDVYEDAATVAKNSLKAGGVVLIVANGIHGSGFVVKMDPDQAQIVPDLLRHLANQMEEDLNRVGAQTPHELH